VTTIHLLAPEIADAIAAGEVIERPASVVKELVENALDADARRISIDVRGAGKISIRVSDDGAGISADDLAMAFVRHATSKVTRLSDLDAIASLGFRGEALASIASVADVDCTSAGARIRVRAGDVIEQGSGPLLPGVSLEVKDLFSNVPARLKFLKSDVTELGVIKDVVSAYALLNPHVRFQLNLDGRGAVGTTGDGDRRRAVANVYGAPVAAELLEIVAMPLVTGVVTQPRLSRGSRDGIVLAVNGRPISSRALVYALEECYQGRLERGRHPVAVIDIGIDPGLVDVNVHPSKREVRFREEGAVFSALQRAVRSALGGSEPFRYRSIQQTTTAAVGAQHAQLKLHEAATAVATSDATDAARRPALLRPIGKVALMACCGSTTTPRTSAFSTTAFCNGFGAARR
jgi:DNA mismatch repair protein MutL